MMKLLSHMFILVFWWFCSIGLPSILALYCLVLMGLKIGWFRAHLRLTGGKSSKVESGITPLRIKINQNYDELPPLYKQTSELSTTSVTNQTPCHKYEMKKPISSSESLRLIKRELDSKAPSNNTTHQKVSPGPARTVNGGHSNEQQHTKIRYEKKSPRIDDRKKIGEVAQFKNPVAIVANKPNVLNRKKGANAPPVHTMNDVNVFESKTPNATISNATNPTVPRNIEECADEEANFKIQIVNETPKKTKSKYEEVEEDWNEASYFGGGGGGGGGDTAYSSQAANIFFKGRTPVSEPRIPKRISDQYGSDDNESVCSQTSA